MKKCMLFLLVSVLLTVNLSGQNKKFKLNQKYAKSVVNSIFHAAKSGSFNHLYNLCDPNGYSDRDAKRICSITQLANTIDGTDTSESAKENLAEFVTIFKSGKIRGDIAYQNDGDTEYAKVPIWYDHPLGEYRSNETMVLVKRTGKWYLYSF